METADFLRRMVMIVESLKLRYMIVGSVASAYYGEPRLTNDVDMVIDLPPQRVREFCAAFLGARLYVSEDAVHAAVRSHSMFNVIDPDVGMKVDFVVAAPGSVEDRNIARSRRGRPEPDYEATFAAPEDVILKKMEFFKEGGSEKHLRDITGMFKISGPQIDRDYITRWAEQLDLMDVWQSLLARIDAPAP